MTRLPLLKSGSTVGHYRLTSLMYETLEARIYEGVDEQSISQATKVLLWQPVSIDEKSEKKVAALLALKEFECFSIRGKYLVDGQPIIVFTKPALSSYTGTQNNLSAEELKSQLFILLPGLEAMHQAGLTHGRLSTDTIGQLDNGYPGIAGLERAGVNADRSDDIKMLGAYCRHLLSRSGLSDSQLETLSGPHADLKNAIHRALNKDGGTPLLSIAEFRDLAFPKTTPATEVSGFVSGWRARISPPLMVMSAAGVICLALIISLPGELKPLKEQAPNTINTPQTIEEITSLDNAPVEAVIEIEAEAETKIEIAQDTIISQSAPSLPPLTPLPTTPPTDLIAAPEKKFTPPTAKKIAPRTLAPTPPSFKNYSTASTIPSARRAQLSTRETSPIAPSPTPKPSRAATTLPTTRAAEPPAQTAPQLTPNSQPRTTIAQTPTTIAPRPARPIKVYKAGDTFKQCDDCPAMIAIAAKGETASFAIGKTELTRAEFKVFLLATGRWPPNKTTGLYLGKIRDRNPFNVGFDQTDQHPATFISATDAIAYTRWLSTRTGKTYRLPTEREWTYAAHPESQKTTAWGDKGRDQCKYANGADEALRALLPKKSHTACNDGYPATAPVATYEPNQAGLYDIFGNVSEWVLACEAPDQCDDFVLRGGSWNTSLGGLAAHSSVHEPAYERSNDFGFRVLLELD